MAREPVPREARHLLPDKFSSETLEGEATTVESPHSWG
jgi:hypothetical protein